MLPDTGNLVTGADHLRTDPDGFRLRLTRFYDMVPGVPLVGNEVSVSQSTRGRIRDRVLTELVEADVEIGFSLVDIAASELSDGNLAFGRKALREAESVVVDVEQRLPGLGSVSSEAFRPLVDELHREIEEAKSGPRTS